MPHTPPSSSGNSSDMQKTKKFIRRLTAYFRLLVYADPTFTDVALLVIGILGAIASGIPFPILGILFGQLVDKLNSATCDAGPGNGALYQSEVNKKVIDVVCIGIAYFVLIYLYIVCFNLAGERLAQRLRDRYFQSLLRQEILFFGDLPAGEVSSRLNGDISLIQQGTSEKVGIILNSIAFLITAYVVAFIKDPKLGGQLVSLLPAFLLMSLGCGHYIQKYSGEAMECAGAAASVAMETLSNVAVVQAFSANARLESKFASRLFEAQKSGIKKAVATAIQSGLLYFIAYGANALAFFQGARIIADAVAANATGSTVGTTYTVIFVLLDASLIISQVAPFLQVFGSAAAAFEKLEKDIDREPRIDGTLEDVGRVLAQVSGNVELRNVSFAYPSRPDRPVLQNVSLTCPAGKHTAIVGLSGSGKSTIAALITRLYDASEGDVLLDGHFIRKLNVRSLRSNISLVQQESSLFDRSILENIAHGLVNSPAHSHLRPSLLGPDLSKIALAVRQGQELTRAAKVHGANLVEIVVLVKQAAALADANSFIDRLKDGYATLVGSSGDLISGGQKQRVSIARALVKEPRILILDEATASLDSSTEQLVQTGIEKAAKGRTLITIAHRLSTIKMADNIIVMRDGQILEQGTHTDMVARGGPYADLVQLQNLNVVAADNQAIASSSATHLSIDLQERFREEIVAKFGEDLDEKAMSDADQSKAGRDPTAEHDSVLGRKRSTWSLFESLAPTFRPYAFIIVIAFMGAIVAGSAYSASAVIFGETVGSLSPCRSEESIRSAGKFFGLMFFVLAVVEFFANAAGWSAFGWIAEKVLYEVRVLSFRSLLEQDLQWHQSERRTPSLLLNFITRDASALAGLTGSIVGTIVSILVNLVVAIILTHIIAWKIALVCLSVVPVMIGAGYMRLISLARFAERHETAFATSVGITVEAINSIKTVASLSLEDEVLGTYRRSLRRPIEEVTLQSVYANLWLAVAYALPNFMYALAYWWGAKRIIAGDYSQTQFFIVLVALLVSAQLWGQMFTLAPDVARARAAVARILNLLDIGSTKRLSGPHRPLDLSIHPAADVEAAAEVREKPLNSTCGVSVTFKQVKFSYPARPNIQVVHGLDLDIQPGQFCALVGPSGAGKSTILSLLERMYTPSSGAIEIDGRDISKREGVSFRDQIALVPQDSVLFDGTIRFNVALGARPDHQATDQEIEDACRLANIHDTIRGLPQGYDTNCGPNGNQLSGGQKQRLGIARALVRKPQLLLLDEPTSALDAESETLLQKGLEIAARGITVIAIAHRLHTIIKANVIFVIEGGRCVDRGTHAELSQRCESYRINVLHQAFDG